MPYQLVWAIFFLPLAAFFIISFVIRPFLNHRPQLAGYTIISALVVAFVFAVWTFLEVLFHGPIDVPTIEWAVINGMTIHIGLLVDSLSAVMLVVVTLVSLMVQIYSQGYMHGDAGYVRYFAFMSLFITSMLGLVIADSLLFMYVFWEGVGLCSYLLIGFWFHKPEAAAAAKKAFIVTRIGDFGFLAAILFLFFQSQNLTGTGTFDIMYFHEHAKELAMIGFMGSSVATWAAVGIFAGAAGKSAQFPLHTWLPDAMEGPTPVSSLIHAATMVAAGVFLVARMFPLFEASEHAMLSVASIGAFTAIFAASMGLVANDIKRVLAYSTISQLGYMMLALGVFGYAAAMFHLFTHAFFKCLLFLGSGSVNHSTGTFDMRYMGGLRKSMPWTFAVYTIGALSLAGIWPLAGFWSKDEVLAHALEHQPVLFTLALITVFMTAFYMFRTVFMTFGGEYRGGAAAASAQGGHGAHAVHGSGHDEPHHLHESPLVMVAPMVFLAVMAVGAGWINFANGGLFSHFLELGEHGESFGFFSVLAHPLPWISLAVAGAGIFLAYAMYGAKWVSPVRVGQVFAPFYKLFSHKYWFDEIYERVFVMRILMNGLFRLTEIFDTYVVDGIVNGVAQGTLLAGRGMRKAQTGQVQVYGFAIAIGIVLIVGAYYLFS